MKVYAKDGTTVKDFIVNGSWTPSPVSEMPLSVFLIMSSYYLGTGGSVSNKVERDWFWNPLLKGSIFNSESFWFKG